MMRTIFQHIQEVLKSTNWNVEEAEETLKKNRKRGLKASAKTRKMKRRKLNEDEDIDIDSDEGDYNKDKVFNRYVILQRFILTIKFKYVIAT